MGVRPLRQYYDEDVRVEVDEDLGGIVEPWLRHRRRFVTSLEGLSEEQWRAPTRCDGWDARDVINHLVTADGFWVASLVGAAAGAPTAYLPNFNPTDMPAEMVIPMRAMAISEVLDAFRNGTDRFIDTVNDLDESVWTVRGESPLGHMPVPMVLAHAHWDSWLHERDIFEPLGIDVPVEDDELMVSVVYALVAGAVQGGLLDDAAPVGPGLDEVIDVSLVFDDLPELPMRVVIDQGVRIERADGDAVAAGSALDLVEIYTGRRDDQDTDAVPAELSDHLRRAFQIL